MLPVSDDWVGWWLARGYGRNPCGESCPYRGEDHAHLRTPDGDDVMLWPDGSFSNFDLSQPARLIFPLYPQARQPQAETI